MKKLIVIFFLLWSAVSHSQIYLPAVPTGYGENVNRVKPIYVLHLPSYSDDLSLHTTDSSSQIRINNGVLQYWNNFRWNSVDSTVIYGVNGISNVSNNTVELDTTYAFFDQFFNHGADTVQSTYPNGDSIVSIAPKVVNDGDIVLVINPNPDGIFATEGNYIEINNGGDSTNWSRVPLYTGLTITIANDATYKYNGTSWEFVARPAYTTGNKNNVNVHIGTNDSLALTLRTDSIERVKLTAAGELDFLNLVNGDSTILYMMGINGVTGKSSLIPSYGLVAGTNITFSGVHGEIINSTGSGSGIFNFDSALATKTTDNLTQGVTKLYNQTHTGDATGATALTVVGIRTKSIPTLSAGNLKYNGTAWVFDNTTYGTGTVTSVATNTGTGITGGTITTTGTLAIDTNLISTRAWRQKGIDSVQANINRNTDSIAAHNTRIINEAIARDNADIKTVAVTGTTTKTVTLTKGDSSTITTTFTDQTGSGSGIDSVRRKSYASDSVLQYSSGTGTYAFRTAREVHVKDFSPYGGDSVHDETTYFQAAANYADSVDAVLIIDKPKVYWKIAGAIDATCKCQIKIPAHSDASRKVFTIKGDKQTSPLPVGGALSAHGTTKTYSGSKLVSTISSGTDADSHVFGTAASLTTLVASDFGIEVHAPAIIGGIGWKLGGDMDVERFTFYSDTDVYDSPLPVINVSGIETPDGSRTENYVVAYNTIIGVKTGILFGEHAHILYNKVYGCVNSYATKPGGHLADGTGNLSQWSVNDFYVGSGNPLAIEWNSFGVEAATSSVVGNKWYVNQYQLNDSLNGLNGIVWYRVDTSNQSGNYTKFIKNGGAYVNAFYLNGDSTAFAKLHTANNIFQQPVGTAPEVLTTIGSFWSGFYAIGASAKYAFLSNRFGNAEAEIYDSTLGKARITFKSNGDVNIGGTTSVDANTCLQTINSTGATQPNFDLIFNGSTGILQKSTARVGIGTLSPSYPIHINVSGNNNVAGFTNGTVTAVINVGSSYSQYGMTSNHELGFFTNNASVMCLSRLGGVGIGNTNTYNLSSTIAQGYLVVQNRIGIGTVTPTSSFENTGSFALKYAATGTGITLGASDNVVEVTATGQTITLPTAASITGRVYTIKLTASGSATIATTSSQTIDGSTTYSLSAQYKYVTVQSNGANWIIIANN